MLTIACSAGGVGVAPQTPQAAPARTRVGDHERRFVPSLHGFRFVNSFEGSPLPFSLGALDAGLGIGSAHGLCGGMSAAAADFFLQGREIPVGESPPARGTAMYDYLRQRQFASLGGYAEMAQKFIRWMSLPDWTMWGTRQRTFAEFEAIRERLARGELVPLGLVLVRGHDLREAWNNHQVLAYGLVERPRGGADIRIYDPNYPGSDGAVIRVQPEVVGRLPFSGPSGVRMRIVGLRCTRVVPDSGETPVRGFFSMPYTRVAPPGALR